MVHIIVFTERGNFPQYDPIAPHIRSRGELSIHNGLNGHPLPRHTALARLDVNVVSVNNPGHAKVGDLEVLVVPHEDVATGQVAVDYVQAGQVLLWGYGDKGQRSKVEG